MEMFLEPIDACLEDIDVAETIQIVEDYKILDIESASMAVALCRGIRKKYPAWKHLIDGDGGDENLKDYPIEENPELTIRSVVNNQMLYQEGWGVGTIKHSLTYSGGLSRSYARTYAPGHHFGFKGFSPFTRPDVVEVAEGIPFIELTNYDVDKLTPSRATSSPVESNQCSGSKCRSTKSGVSNTGPPQSIRFAKTSRLAKGNCAKISWSFIPESPDSTGLVYPEEPAARSRWILQRRSEKNPSDPTLPYAWLLKKSAPPRAGLLMGSPFS